MSAAEEIVVADSHALADCCAELAKATHLGFDTEFVGEETYEPSLCLIQVATPGTLYLIDPLSAGPLDAFWQLLVEPTRTVIVHAGREEVRLCRRMGGQAPTNWFDLQIAAGLVGLAFPMSHAALVNQFLGVQLSKGETLTEWRHRPLSQSQLTYAFDDVRYLLPVWQRLDAKLGSLNRREWAQQEFSRFVAQSLPEVNNQAVLADKWRKLRGISSLDRRRLGLVREMFQAREAIAANVNRPARYLVRDDLLIEIARRNPKSPDEIQTMRGMAKRFVTPMWEAVERARQLDGNDLPTVVERDRDRPQVALIVNLVAAILNDFCARQRLAFGLTATMNDLRDLVRAKMQKADPSASNVLLTGWRRDAVLPILLEVLEGQRSVRIADLQADSPFAFE
jgi:ribonuclease D